MSWQLASFLVLVFGLGAGFLWYEREKPAARVLSLVAALAALAVVGRLAFAAIPNVKPSTDIVLFAGYALGAAPGFAVGAVTALVSNIFLSQGPWTVWQMAGWGGVGVGGALLARAMRGRELGRFRLALVCAVAGLAFGAWMDVYQWTLAARQDLDSYLAVSASSLPYNLAHAIGNVVFCLLIGPVFIRALRRYRRRFEVRWEAASAAAAVVAALAVATGLAAPPPAQAASTSSKAAKYLLRAQNRDGGFGGVPRGSSSHLMTGWAALGLAAARNNPRDVRRRRGRAITTYLRRRAGSLRDVGEVERTILVLRAAGLSPRRFRGRNLVAEVLSRKRGDGSIAGYVSYTAFGILAFKAAGEPIGSNTIAWLEDAQKPDGGFGLTPSAGADFDMTGATLQALAAVGRGGRAAASGAVAYLRRGQNPDGGFPQMEGGTSNAQSTAYAVQGLLAVRAGGDQVARALSYLKRLQRRNGSIKYSSVSRQTPVWVTAQALMALRRKALPFRPVRRKRKRRRRASSAAAASRSSSDRERGEQRETTAEPASEPLRRAEATGSSAASVATRRASAAGEEGGPSAWLVAGASTAALAAIFGLRLWLRRRRRAAAG